MWPSLPWVAPEQRVLDCLNGEPSSAQVIKPMGMHAFVCLCSLLWEWCFRSLKLPPRLPHSHGVIHRNEPRFPELLSDRILHHSNRNEIRTVTFSKRSPQLFSHMDGNLTAPHVPGTVLSISRNLWEQSRQWIQTQGHVSGQTDIRVSRSPWQ